MDSAQTRTGCMHPFFLWVKSATTLFCPRFPRCYAVPVLNRPD